MTALRAAAIVFLFLAASPWAVAGGQPLDPSQFPDPNSLLGPNLVNAAVKTIGLATSHRAYEPATPLGTALGFDMGIELTLSKLPEDFSTALKEAGSSGAENIPFLPVPRINLHKGIGQSADLGISAILFRGYRIIGYELKFALLQPEEGLNWALRFGYTTCTLRVPSNPTLELATRTFTPELLVSKPLDWAEPYLGVGYSYALGSVTLIFDLPDPFPDQTSTASGHGGGFRAFTGVGMKVPNLGFKLSLEGAYSSAGATTLGTKFGFSF